MTPFVLCLLVLCSALSGFLDIGDNVRSVVFLFFYFRGCIRLIHQFKITKTFLSSSLKIVVDIFDSYVRGKIGSDAIAFITSVPGRFFQRSY